MQEGQAIADLETLLKSMKPQLDPRQFLFVTLRSEITPSLLSEAVMVFREREGTTLILPAETARECGLDAAFPCKMITLNVHSDLAAVGFLAAILPRLASAGIGVNPVSAFFHDHLFVPADRAEDALTILQELSLR